MIPVGDKFKFLARLPIFSEAGEEDLMELASVIKEKEVLKGSAIIRKGEEGHEVFIIARGRVRVHDGNHVLARLGEGEVFGEYALIDQHTRSASVTADEPCLLLRLEYDDFYRIGAVHPGILRGVLRELIRRMRDMNILEEKLSRSYLKISRQKELIEKQHENISRQKVILEQQNFDLTKLNEEKNQFISMVIHQIKNPLTSTLCMADMLLAREASVDETEKEGLNIIRNSVKRINNLINEMLDINAIESKVYQLKTEPLHLTSILNEITGNYRYFIDQKEIILETELSDITARLNRVYITQIFDNLLSNAVKFTPAKMKITIRLWGDDDSVNFEITDEGPGIDCTKADAFFNRYQRQKPMMEQENGMEGLGLAIVHKYTTAMGGEIECEGKPGAGSRFRVKLPNKF